MSDSATIGLYKEDGQLKTKEEFLSEMTNLYDKCTQTHTKGFDYLDYVTTSENQIDPEITYKTFNFLGRYFYINDEITEDTAQQIHQFINFWNEIDNIDKTPSDEMIPLTIYINSVGGDLDAAFSIISAIQASKIPVNTVVIGRAWSAAFLISICGATRLALKYSTFLFHEGNALYGENAHKFIQFSDFYKQTWLENIKDITINNTKITSEIYQIHKNDDWWLTAKDALEYGIIDMIITKEEEKE